MVVERALLEPDVDDDALVLVVVRVEDEGLERRRRDRPSGAGCGLTIASRISVIADPLLRRGEDHLLVRDREDALQLLHDDLRLGRREVDLVEDRDDREPLAQGEVDVGERLGLDALGGVHDEDRALARLQAAADLVAEVDVAGRVDEVEARSARPSLAVYSRRTARALIVIPFSRSRSIESRTWLVIWRGSIAWVASRRRSASVDFP